MNEEKQNNSPIPLYIQIREIIREEIISGEYLNKNYDLKSLSNRFNAHVLTIRKSIEKLKEDGLMISVRGKGTYVTPHSPITENIDKPLNFLGENSNRLKVVFNKFEWINSNNKISNIINIEENTKILYIERLRYLKDTPLAIEYRYIRLPWAQVISKEKLESKVISQIIKEECNVTWDRIENEIKSILSDEVISHNLNINLGTPLLSRELTIHDDKNQIIVCGSSYYISSLYRWKTTISMNNDYEEGK